MSTAHICSTIWTVASPRNQHPNAQSTHKLQLCGKSRTIHVQTFIQIWASPLYCSSPTSGYWAEVERVGWFQGTKPLNEQDEIAPWAGLHSTPNLPPLELQHMDVQLQHNCNTSSPNCKLSTFEVIRTSNLRVMVAIHIYVAISTVAIENVAIELLQLTML